MDKRIWLSLCIPTNGICEWVKPVIDSIYSEENPIGNFEVIVTDNGCNQEFQEMMNAYCSKYNNLIYKKTDAVQFANQIEAFKIAKGEFIKFVNHRMLFLPGALNYLLKFVIDNIEEKPFVYFLENKCAGIYPDFDQYVKGLSYWSSYSGGTAMWKSDFDELDLFKPINELFPHIGLIFGKKDSNQYIIDGHKIMNSLPTDDRKKGRYNLFYAFAVEYPFILLELYREKQISLNTFLSVKRDNLGFIAELYVDYVLIKKPCSYDLSNSRKNINLFYNTRDIYIRIPAVLIRKIGKKIIGLGKKIKIRKSENVL